MVNEPLTLPELNLTDEQKVQLKTLLYRLDWIHILQEAVMLRRSSWGKDVVVEWRNASDCVSSAVIRALEEVGVLLTFKEEIKK